MGIGGFMLRPWPRCRTLVVREAVLHDGHEALESDSLTRKSDSLLLLLLCG